MEAFRDAVHQAGCVPEFFNTDQGCQFTSETWTGMRQSAGVRVSMDGNGRWIYNLFIESLLHRVNHEGVYL
jgi:putative transposase